MPPKWFKPTAILITVWMAIGVLMLVMDLTASPESIAALPEVQQQMRAERPLWLMIDFGIATVLGLAGAIALVSRKAVAVPLLLISLVAVTVQFGYTTIGMDAIAKLGAAHALGLPGTVFLIGAASLWVGIKARNEGWLN